jgi:NADH-quinone oxidoreductase subunit J
VSVALLALLVVGISREAGIGDRPGWSEIVVRPEPPAGSDRARILTEGMAPVVGVEMMTRFVVAFEAAGLLLTAAVVGAIALAIGDRPRREPASAPAEAQGVEEPVR